MPIRELWRREGEDAGIGDAAPAGAGLEPVGLGRAGGADRANRAGGADGADRANETDEADEADEVYEDDEIDDPSAGFVGLPRRTPRRPLVERLLEQNAGIIATHELLSAGMTPEEIRLLRRYGRLRPLRKGWHASPDLPDACVLAWRFGGPLACVSALLHHGVIDECDLESTDSMHVCVRTGTARVPRPLELAERWRIAEPARPVVHWSTRDHASGDRRAVSIPVALAQATLCRPRLAARLSSPAARP